MCKFFLILWLTISAWNLVGPEKYNSVYRQERRHIEKDGMKKNKKNIYLVYPKSLEAVSMNNLAMSELLLNELIFSQNECIKFHVNTKMRLIECNDSKVKKILDLLLKAGKLPVVKMQLLELIHKENCSNGILGRLKFFIDNKQIDLIVEETKSGADFTWEVTHDVK